MANKRARACLEEGHRGGGDGDVFQPVPVLNLHVVSPHLRVTRTGRQPVRPNGDQSHREKLWGPGTTNLKPPCELVHFILEVVQTIIKVAFRGSK
eukprot:scaffold126351_cov53-Prasinocladus_malaysianus.AAC.1